MSSIQSSVQTRLQTFYGFEGAHELESFSSLVGKSKSLGTFKERLFQKEHVIKIYTQGEWPLPIHTEVEREGTPEAFFGRSSTDFLNVSSEESETLGLNLWNIGIFGTSSCRNVDCKFNPNTPLLHTPDNHMWW